MQPTTTLLAFIGRHTRQWAINNMRACADYNKEHAGDPKKLQQFYDEMEERIEARKRTNPFSTWRKCFIFKAGTFGI